MCWVEMDGFFKKKKDLFRTLVEQQQDKTEFKYATNRIYRNRLINNTYIIDFRFNFRLHYDLHLLMETVNHESTA
jgi:hypothetical protein